MIMLMSQIANACVGLAVLNQLHHRIPIIICLGGAVSGGWGFV